MLVAAGIEYCGKRFHGWQNQPGLLTVQSHVEHAASKVANRPIQVHCAGRTDTGVHATEQIIHFDTEVVRNNRAWLFGMNSNLPKDIAIHWVREVPEDFHARFSAMSRRYCYVLYNAPVRPALFDGMVTWHYQKLNAEKMAQAAQYFLGEHDFTSFRASQCQSQSPNRYVFQFNVLRKGPMIVFDITANAFLHHMVRNMVGALMRVGAGKAPVNWIAEVLAAKDRKASAETAPPYGLYLSQVCYPDHYKLPNRLKLPLFL